MDLEKCFLEQVFRYLAIQGFDNQKFIKRGFHNPVEFLESLRAAGLVSNH